MKALVFGADGQLGRALVAGDLDGWSFTGLNRGNCDISDEAAVREIIKDSDCEIVINAAAYTQVDKAESEAELAGMINAAAPGWMADQCAASGKSFVHISTDFVFGDGHSRPIETDAQTQALSVYGDTKLMGEEMVRAAKPDALIIRTSWVYAARGGNFLLTMLRLMAEREELGVVSDQIGTPTAATDLAAAIVALADGQATGIYHYTNAGVASWYDFAVAIHEEARAMGLLTKDIRINPIPGSAYPTPAARPHYSVLDKDKTWTALGAPARHWRSAMKQILTEIKEHG